jgi:arabinofuranosyltransferase
MLQVLRTHPLISLLVFIFFVLLVQTSWIGDDAYITMRTVDNFISGYGLRWNVLERVQTYTHPLWMFMLSGVYILVRDSALTLLGLSIGISTLTVWLFLGSVPKNNWGVVLAWLGFVLSKAFVDYSTSGLENPLTHLLALIFLLLYLDSKTYTPHRLFGLRFVASLSVVNRLDTILFYIPALLHVFWQNRDKRSFGLLIAGMIPVMLWELFSLVYYGFFLPNTYYAKLTSGIPLSDLAAQGLDYYINSFIWNPITLTVIFISILLSVFCGTKSERFLALGILFYLVYVILIGGDFMSGRFFTLPFFASIFLLIRYIQERSKIENFACITIFILLGTIFSPKNAFSSREIPIPEQSNGIADESTGYYIFTNLMLLAHEDQLPIHPWANMGRDMRSNESRVMEIRGVGAGMFPFFIGPNVHLIDPLALCDPLLARLPMRPQEKWRIAHYERNIPLGYIESLEYGENRLKNPDLAIYYDKLRLVTSGDIWSSERWQAIWGFNTGEYASLLDSYLSDQKKP